MTDDGRVTACIASGRPGGRSRRARAWRGAAATLALLALLAPTVGSAVAQERPARVVAVGDVHGDLDRFEEILREAALIDGDGRWTGGDAHLVTVGDMVDRGPASNEVLALLRDLQRHAPGRVHPLMGNHEAMTVMRDVRYVALEEYTAFASGASEELREERYRSWIGFLTDRAERLGFPPPDGSAEARDRWLSERPPGFFERQQAFGPGAELGEWLRGLDAALLLDGTLFVHGGPSEAWPFESVAALNERASSEVRAFDARWAALAQAGVIWPHATWSDALALVAEELDLWAAVDSLPAGQVDPAALAGRPANAVLDRMRELLASETWAIAAPQGPLWYRGLAEEAEPDLRRWVTPLLDRLGARRVAVGHTPTPDHRITLRLGGSVVLLDSGLSRAVGGRASALVIEGDELRALYRGGRAEALAAATDALLGKAAAAVEAFLREAPIVAVRRIGTGTTKPSRATLDDGTLRHDAAVQTVHACEDVAVPGRIAVEECDSWKHNVAAYELAKLVGLASVVPSVARRIDGRPGAFTWWIDDAMTFDEMKKLRLNPPDGTAWNAQQNDMGVFDELIYNTDRNQGNVLVDARWRIWLIDHTRAFRADPGVRNAALLARLRPDAALVDGLRALTDANVAACCSDLLTRSQRGAVLARRDRIVASLCSRGVR